MIIRIGHNSISAVPGIVAIIMSVLALLAWPYGYYVFLRFAVTGMAVYYAYYLYQANGLNSVWFWIFAFSAVLFNPFMPVYLGDKGIWSVINVGLAIVVGIFIGTNRR